MFIDNLKSLCEVYNRQRQRVSLTYEQKFGDNCFQSHLKEKPTKHLKSMSGVTRTSSHSSSMQAQESKNVNLGPEASPAEKSAASPEREGIEMQQNKQVLQETSETKGPSKQTADDVLAAISEKQWDVDCVQSFDQNIGENLVRTLVFHTISNEDCERKD